MTQYTITSIRYPGATSTFAQGINASGEIVGYYEGADQIPHGFTDNAGVFTSYDEPLGRATFVYGVNASGTLVGLYEDPSGSLHGFTTTGGIATTLDYPGATTTAANGVNASGQVVGTYLNGIDQHGFLYNAGSYAALNYPGSRGTLVGGINDVGDVSGSYVDSGFVVHGFYTQNGALVSVDYPNASNTQVTGINNAHDVVGEFNLDRKTHGFTDVGGVFSPVDVPGATITRVFGIDDAGDVVGTSTDANGVSTGFLAVPVCFAAGTLIATPAGGVPVEALRVGDLVSTASGRCRPVRWLGSRRLDCRRHPRPRDVLPIRISAHAFGAGKPSRDLTVSPGHAICIEAMGEILVPAGALVDGTTIAQVEVSTVTYWHVELDSHDILLAEDLPAESYLDMGNRSFFAGCGVVALQAAPDAAVPSRAGFCRPFHADGPLVEAVRARRRAKPEAVRQPRACGKAS